MYQVIPNDKKLVYAAKQIMHIAHGIIYRSEVPMVIKVCVCVFVFFFLSVTLNRCENCFQVSPLWCGACGLPITQFW